jgi:ribosomal protein S18 acetylase RimI-like enzyme
VSDVFQVRPYDEADRPALTHLFAHAGKDSPTEQLWGHLGSEADVYLNPYLDGPPGFAYVAQLDSGTLVGYLLGCLDTAGLPSESERMERSIRRHRLYLRPRPVSFFARALVDSAVAKRHGSEVVTDDFDDDRWPAHLHINVAPEGRGTGAADLLMSRWLERLAADGTVGCHVQTVQENLRAVRFFTRHGFRPLGTAPLIPGLRVRGQHVHQLTMVRPSPRTG